MTEGIAVKLVRNVLIGLALASLPIYGAIYFIAWAADEHEKRTRKKQR
jgi:hypothetical protein